MTGKLIINSVHADNFGGLSKRRLDIPGEGMVVIHGRNETGKSTLSELITWLLVGPSTDSNVIRMLGKPDEILSGEMEGRLKGRSFLARGDFRITPRSWEIAKASARVYEIDELISPEAWLHGLGDIDRANLQGIYRLWGQQLHDGGDADSEMRRAGLGAIAMSVDPRVTVKQLIDSSKPGAKLGEGDSSFSSISAELKEVSQAVELANNNIVEYNSKVSELAELQSRGAKLREMSLGLNRRRANLESFKNLDELRITKSEALDELRDQPEVPEAWLPAVGQIHRLRSAIQQCDRLREMVETAKESFGKGVAAVGLASTTTPSEVVERFSITTHDTVSVGKAVSNVGHAVDAHVSAIEAVGATEAAKTAAEVAAVRAAAQLGADLDQVRAANLESAELEFRKAQDELTRIESDISHSEGEIREETAVVAEAAEAVRLAEERWEQFGAGMPAIEWRQGGGNRNISTEGPSMARRLSPVLVLVLAAIVAAVLTQWILVALIVVAALFAWFAPPSPAEVDHDPSMGEAADQLVTAETKLDLVRATLAGDQQRLAGKDQQLTEAKLAMQGIGPRFGIDLPDDPIAIESALAGWGAAAELIEGFDQSCDKHAEATRQCDLAAAARQTRLSELDSLLTGFGMPAGIDPDAAEDLANSHVELVARAIRLIENETAAAAADAELADSLGPVADEVADWKLEEILRSAEEAVVAHANHTVAAAKANGASDRISDFVGNNTDLTVLIDAGLDTALANIELKEIDDQSKELDQQQQTLAEQIGVAKEEKKRLESEQQLADLRLTQGSLEEVRTEIGFELASRRLAALVLQHVADEYERKNQPELIRHTGALALSVAKEWSGVEVRLDDARSTSLMVNLANGSAVPVAALSTGARALLYLSLRVAMAEHDTERRGVALPLICDDPLVHIDDQRAGAAMRLLADASKSRQVVMFTCHERTMEVAESIGVVTHRI